MTLEELQTIGSPSVSATSIQATVFQEDIPSDDELVIDGANVYQLDWYTEVTTEEDIEQGLSIYKIGLRIV